MNYCIFYLISINIAAFFTYGFDKLLAKIRKRRVSEVTLLTYSILGGAYGGFLGMHLFNHKTKVKRFKVINVFMMLLYAGLFYYFWEYVWS